MTCARPLTLVLAMLGATLGLLLPAAPAGAAEREELISPWVPPGATAVSEDRLSALFRVFRKDAKTNALLKSVTSKLGASDPLELASIIRICEDLPEDEPARIDKSGRDVSICIRPGARLFDAFQSLVHEFAHLEGHLFLLSKGMGQNDDILSYGSPEDYVDWRIDQPGSEVDAYAAQIGAMTRLRSRVRGRLPGDSFTVQDMRRYFSPKGRLRDPDGLRSHILDRMGYRAKYLREYELLRRRAGARN